MADKLPRHLRCAVPRDLLTGAPLDPDAQIIRMPWYPRPTQAEPWMMARKPKGASSREFDKLLYGGEDGAQ